MRVMETCEWFAKKTPKIWLIKLTCLSLHLIKHHDYGRKRKEDDS